MDGCCFRCFLLNVRERAVVALVFRNGWKVLSIFVVFWSDVAGVSKCFMPKGRAFSSELCRFSDSVDDVVETFEFCPEYDFTIRVHQQKDRSPWCRPGGKHGNTVLRKLATRARAPPPGRAPFTLAGAPPPTRSVSAPRSTSAPTV